jgi:hypothetical protein
MLHCRLGLLLPLLLLSHKHNLSCWVVLGLCQPAVMHKHCAAAVVGAGHLKAHQPPSSTNTTLNKTHSSRLQQAYVGTLRFGSGVNRAGHKQACDVMLLTMKQ